MTENYVIDVEHPIVDSDTGYEIIGFYKVYQDKRFVGVANTYSSNIFYRVENETITLPNFETWDFRDLYWLCGLGGLRDEDNGDKLKFHIKEARKYYFERIMRERDTGTYYDECCIHYVPSSYLFVKEGKYIYPSLTLNKEGASKMFKYGIDVVFKQARFVFKAIPIIFLRLYLLEFKKIFDFSSDSTYIAFRESVDSMKYALSTCDWTYFETEIISDRELSKRQLRYQYKKQNGLLFLQELRELSWQKN